MGRRSTTERGYGSQHQRVRAGWQDIIDTSDGVQCACDRLDCTHDGQCPTIIRPDDMWDLGHDDVDRRYWTGPECIPCNRSAGGRNGARVSNRQRQMTVRPW